MLHNIIKAAFAIIGAITGVTLSNVIINSQGTVPMDGSFTIAVVAVVAIFSAGLFYWIASVVIGTVVEGMDRLEVFIQRMTLYEIMVSSIGLIAGLIVANLIAIPINKIEIIGVPLAIITNILFGCMGIAIAVNKRNDLLFEGIKKKNTEEQDSKHVFQSNIVDTSVIIDGRICDICKTGFLFGELIIPEFVLEELRHLADSADALKRGKGKRGLEILNTLQKELQYPVRIENIEIETGTEVDDKLLKAAKQMDARIVTVDYNLLQVATLQGISVLNINELANAVKPIALPGEEMLVQVVKDGKEHGQGVGYMDDGTMIVVDGGKKHMGEKVNVTVTSVLQTSAGRMIFAKTQYDMENVV